MLPLLLSWCFLILSRCVYVYVYEYEYVEMGICVCAITADSP